MKPLKRKNYGSIPHLSNSKLGPGDYYVNFGMECILTEKARDKNDLILAFEKYDGTNIGIAKKNGKIYALTRSGYEAKTSPYIQHHRFSDWVYERQDLFNNILNNEDRICGEWLIQAHGLKYVISGEPIKFFDYFTPDNNRQPFEYLEELNYTYNIPLARLLHSGNPIKVIDLLNELNKKTNDLRSVEAPEGIVYRVERNGEVDFLAKWVRNDFEPGIYCIGVSEENLIWNQLKTPRQ